MKRYLMKGGMGKFIQITIAFCFALALTGVAQVAFAQSPFIVQPTSIHLGKVQQGDTILGSIQITNGGGEAITVEALAEGRLITGKIGDCITLSPSELDIPPGESGFVSYNVVIPSDADPGSYIFGLVFKQSAQPMEGSGVTVVTAAETTLSFTVNGIKVAFYEVSDVEAGDDFKLRAIIWNYEDSEIGTRAVFDLFDDQQTLLQSLESPEEILGPGTTRLIEFSKTTEDMDWGDYRVVGKFYRNDQLFKEIERQFSVGLAILGLSNLLITPASVDPDEEVMVSVEVTNTGNIEGTYNAILMINDTTEQTEDVIVAPGATENATFMTSRTELGTYSVAIAELSGTFTVTPAAWVINWWMLGGIIGAGLFIAGILVLLAFIRRRDRRRVQARKRAIRKRRAVSP